LKNDILRRLEALESSLGAAVVGVLFDSEDGTPGALVRVAGQLLPEVAFRDKWPRATLVHVRYTEPEPETDFS
jgi:hypothetical protein